MKFRVKFPSKFTKILLKFVPELVEIYEKTILNQGCKAKGGPKERQWLPRCVRGESPPCRSPDLFGAIFGQFLVKNAKKSQREPKWSQKSGKRTSKNRCKNRCRKSNEKLCQSDEKLMPKVIKNGFRNQFFIEKVILRKL